MCLMCRSSCGAESAPVGESERALIPLHNTTDKLSYSRRHFCALLIPALLIMYAVMSDM